MAWACRLGYTKRLLCMRTCCANFQKTLQIVFLISVINLNFGTSSGQICSKVKNCLCLPGAEDDELEIQCPRGVHEVYDITLKVKQLASGEAFLTMTCNPDKPDISPELIDGFSFRTDDDNQWTYNVTRVLVQYCAASTKTYPYVLKDLFSKMNLPLERLQKFTYSPSSKFSTPFPMDLLEKMTSLEVLEVQRFNITRLGVISNLTELRELVLRDNRISVIKHKAFKFMPKLEHLDLSLNVISNISEDAFPESLVHLNLAKNNLDNFHPQILKRLHQLEELVLTRNPLQNLHPEAFVNSKALRVLQMDSTQFAQFPKFQNLNLQRISISYRDGNGEEASSAPSPLTLESAAIEDSEDGLQVVVTDMPDLTEIVFVQDGLKRFPRLENITNLNTLLLSGNQFTVIPEHALKFPALKTLDLSGNRLVKLSVIETQNLTFLDLSKNQLEELQGAVFSKLTNLESLDLSMNKIHTIGPKVFRTVTKLTFLDLSTNLLSFEETKTKSQEDLQDSGNGGFFSDDFDHQSPLRFCMKLERLDLSSNRIQNIFNDWKILFGQLKLLNLTKNYISYLHSTTLTFTANDLILDITDNNISTIAMNNAEFLLEDQANHVIRIFLDGNPLNCDCKIVAFKNFKVKGVYFKYTNLTCAEPLWLQGIQFRSVPPTDLICPIDTSLGCPSICECWDVPANKTIAVDCSYRSLGDDYIPDVHEINGPWAQRYDFTLNLAGNNISDLDSNRTKNLSSRIAKIDLSQNRLTSLNFLNLLSNNNQSSFYLAANHFSCNDCNFHRMLRSHFKRVPDYDNVSCLLITESSGEKQTVRYIAEKFPEDEACIVYITAEVQAMIIVASIFLVFLIVFIAVYFRYGWALRAYLYSKGFGCCFGLEEEEEQGKTYDAFVSYSHKDEDWVLTQLVPRLEEQEGFKLCLHFRDWTPGDWIPDQIVRSVDKSRRTIVILSKHFVESVWSRLEFKAAHSQALTDKANRLILVMMDEDLKDQDVKDDDLRVYMKMNTYLKYGDPWFWHKLKYALPHRHKKTVSAEAVLLKQQQRERAIQLDKLRAKMENTIIA